MTIAGARLDIAMGQLWHHLDRHRPFEWTRWQQAFSQSQEVRRLADERLEGRLRLEVIDALDAVEDARKHRNGVVHQDWLLRGRDATRSVAELSSIPPEELSVYVEDWDREAKDSAEWQRVPSRSVQVLPAQPVADLRIVERELAAASDLVTRLTFTVASSRETGRPPGYIRQR